MRVHWIRVQGIRVEGSMVRALTVLKDSRIQRFEG